MARWLSGRVLPIFLCGLGVGLIAAVLGIHFYLGGSFAHLLSPRGAAQAPAPVDVSPEALYDAVDLQPGSGPVDADVVPNVANPLQQTSDESISIDEDNAAQKLMLSDFLKLSAAFQAGAYDNVVQLYRGRAWGPHAQKAEALYVQAVAQLALTGEASVQDALTFLSAQIAQDPTRPSYYAFQAQLLVEQGLIEQAIAGLASGQQWMQSPEDLAVLGQAQWQVLNRHLRFLQQNRLWTEIIDFAQDPSFQQDPSFYLESQLALAQAYAGLYDWSLANEALEQATLSAPGDPRITALQDKVDDLYSQQQARHAKGVDAEWFSVEAQRQGDSLIVPVRLGNGARVNLLVDTGATISTLNQSTFERISSGLSAQRLGSRAFISASGRFEAPVILLDELSVPPVSASKIEFALISEATPGIDGLLGMNFLKHFEFSVDVSVPELKLRLK